MATEKDGKPPDPGKPPERAKKKATRSRLLARLRMQQAQNLSGHVTRTIEQTPVDRTKQPNPRLKKRGATADTAPGNSGKKQAIYYPSEDDRNTWQATNGRSTNANPLLAAADEKLASLEAKLTKSEDRLSKVTMANADLQTQKEDLEDRLEKAQEHLRNSDAAVADKVAEVQHLKVQAAHLEGKLVVFEKFQPYQGGQPSHEIDGGTSDSNESGLNPAANLDTSRVPSEVSPTSATITPTAPLKPALKIPTLPAWDGSSQKDEDGVNVFLPRLAQYLEAQGVSKEKRPHNVFPFLKGKAFQLWQLEAETLTQGNIELTWELFAKFMCTVVVEQQ
jgi:hypothetical protein